MNMIEPDGQVAHDFDLTSFVQLKFEWTTDKGLFHFRQTNAQPYQ